MKRLQFFNYKIQNNSNGSCDVYIDGAIVDASTEQIYKDWWGDDTVSSFRSVRQQIENSGAKSINIYINSGGGQVTEAMAIHDYIVSLQAKGVTVNTYGRGIIASAATYILMASNNSTISENSYFMIHNVSGFAYGDVDQVESQAATLRKFNDDVTAFYSNRTGLSTTVIGNMMKKETWMNGKEAKEKGFVVNVEAEQKFTNSITPDQWVFNNTDVLAAYNSFTNNPTNMDISKIINGVKDAFINSLKEAGILKDDNTQMCETLTNALDTALAPMNEGINSAVNDAVAEATKGLNDLVNTAVTEATKNLLTNEAVQELLKPITENVEAIQDKLVDGASSAGKRKEKEDGPVNAENHKGITWG